MKRTLWLILGLLAVVLGVIGVFLPLLPTVPFLLLAAFCFARSSARLHDWLLSHPTFGPPIADWQRSGAISRRAKILASLSLIAAFGFPLWLGVRAEVLAIQVLILSAVALFIWTRPEA